MTTAELRELLALCARATAEAGATVIGVDSRDLAAITRLALAARWHRKAKMGGSKEIRETADELDAALAAVFVGEDE